LIAVLQDTSTDVPTTAATLNADDNDDDNHCQSHLSIFVDNNSASDPTFLQEWNQFNSKIIHQSNGALMPSTNKIPLISCLQAQLSLPPAISL